MTESQQPSLPEISELELPILTDIVEESDHPLRYSAAVSGERVRRAEADSGEARLSLPPDMVLDFGLESGKSAVLDFSNVPSLDLAGPEELALDAILSVESATSTVRPQSENSESAPSEGPAAAFANAAAAFEKSVESALRQHSAASLTLSSAPSSAADAKPLPALDYNEWRAAGQILAEKTLASASLATTPGAQAEFGAIANKADCRLASVDTVSAVTELPSALASDRVPPPAVMEADPVVLPKLDSTVESATLPAPDKCMTSSVDGPGAGAATLSDPKHQRVSVIKIAAVATAASMGGAPQRSPIALVNEAVLIDSLYQTLLPRMKGEVSLRLQRVLEAQAQQMVSEVMEQFKGSCDDLLCETLRVGLYQAIADLGGEGH